MTDVAEAQAKNDPLEIERLKLSRSPPSPPRSSRTRIDDLLPWNWRREVVATAA
jgi:hypothetical protein